jgi:hypothetical protein
LAREGTLGKVALVGATAGEGSEAKIEEVLGSYQAIQLTDVIPAGDERAKGLTFDSQSIVKVKNAQVYTLATAAKEGKFYLKVSVGFDQPLAKQLTAEWEKEQSEKQKAAGSAGEGAKEGGETAKKPELPLSNEGEAAELHKKFQSWVYELASFQAEKLRKDRKSLADAPAQSEEQAGEEADEEAGTDVTPGESVRPLGVPTPTE